MSKEADITYFQVLPEALEGCVGGEVHQTYPHSLSSFHPIVSVVTQRLSVDWLHMP